MFDYDLFVIGAGSGGVRAARIAATHGARVGIAEEFRCGGTCVIRGCVPKKLLVYASHFSEEFEDAAGFGWSVSQTKFDWKTLIQNKNKEINRLESVYQENIKKAGVELIKSRAELIDRNTIKLARDDRIVTARIILIATGGTPFVDSGLPGHELAITSNEVFDLTESPNRIVIVGGGYIAVEFAGIFNNLGADTTLVYRGEEILRGFDDEVRINLHEEMKKKGIKVVVGEQITKLERQTNGIEGEASSGKKYLADQYLYATGRRPNTNDIGLEKVGVELGKSGAIVVDEYSQTNIDNIYAVGDVTSRINLTPVAIREGHAFADTVFGSTPRTVDHTNVPSAVFSQPEIGTVGLNEQQARDQYQALDIYKSKFRPMKATLSGNEEMNFIKLIVDAESQRILGVQLMGYGSGELIQVIGIAIKMGATKEDFDATMAVHPTMAEEIVTMREPTESIRN